MSNIKDVPEAEKRDVWKHLIDKTMNVRIGFVTRKYTSTNTGRGGSKESSEATRAHLKGTKRTGPNKNKKKRKRKEGETDGI